MKLAGLVFLLLLVSPLHGQTVTHRISLDDSGNQLQGGSHRGDIAAWGRRVAFSSDDWNVVPGDTNVATDVFLRDRVNGTVERVSVDSKGVEADANSERPCCSFDGLVIAFDSNATNLVAGDTNNARDIFVRDIVKGKTTRVSISTNGTQANGESIAPRISANGNIVLFGSDATNLVAQDTNGVRDVFWHNRRTGNTKRASVSSTGMQADGQSWAGRISANGTVIVFMSWATNLVPGDTNGYRDMFAYDRTTNLVERLSVDSAGNEADGPSGNPAGISADGRYVVFISRANNLAPNSAHNRSNAFLRDRLTGTTECISVTQSGAPANGDTRECDLSDDGLVASLVSYATNLAPGNDPQYNDLFLKDLRTGGVRQLNKAPDGSDADDFLVSHLLSPCGRHVGYESPATNLVIDDTNNSRDSFVSGAELSLAIEPVSARLLDPVSVSIFDGDPGKPAALYSLAVNGTPFVRLLFKSSFSPSGVVSLAAVVPNDPALSGLTLTLGAFGAVASSDRPAQTNPVTLEIL